MKKVILFLVLILCALSSFAVPLPDGSDARITEIRQSNGKIVSVRLKEVAILNTPLGGGGGSILLRKWKHKVIPARSFW